jgi:uncharacterized protein YggU (UPF0235/DUF167 family)
VQAPPVDGAANTALIRLLASELRVPASSIRIVSGATARQKVVEVEDVDRQALRSRWADLDV